MNSLELYDTYVSYYDGREPAWDGSGGSPHRTAKSQRVRQPQTGKPLAKALSARQVGDQRVEHHHAGRRGAQA
jgi:hypothetical protein